VQRTFQAFRASAYSVTTQKLKSPVPVNDTWVASTDLVKAALTS